MQDGSKKAVQRIQNKLVKVEEIAQESTKQLKIQNERLMKIDTSLQTIDTAGKRLPKYMKELRKEMLSDKLHCCMVMCICLNVITLIVVLAVPF